MGRQIIMPRLSSTAREKLYLAECDKARAAGKGDLPICNLCGTPIDGRRDSWHVSHDPAIPRHMGGEVLGIAHAQCNTKHNNQHDTPLYWKIVRVRQRHIGARVTRSRPLLGTKASGWKRKMNGEWVRR